MTVLMFATRFAPLVASGAKHQTIRGPRKRPVLPGDPLSLRAWSGSAYRSPQRVLRETACEWVEPVVIDRPFFGPLITVELAGVILPPPELDAFARADGFAGVEDMDGWYRTVRQTPFRGVVIRWEVARA